MIYKEMLEEAKAKGLTSEAKMWASVDDIDSLLCLLKKEHKDIFWKFIRKQHCLLYDGHYSEEFAEHDVRHLRWKDNDGHEHSGAHWSKECVTDFCQGMPFPPGTTDCDKYVAYNVMYSDLCKALDEEQIKRVAYTFFFCDDDFDYTQGSKIWHYKM